MWVYSLASSVVTSSVVYYAYATREQFYPTVVFLVTSKLCVACLGNQAIVCTLLVGRAAKTVFLGTLREVEVELLYENVRYAITETCLALTIFREELTTRVFALFTALLFSKVFHWLAGSRVDYLEHAERVTVSSHLRLASLMAWLLVVDASALCACAYACAQHGASVLLLFGFEFAILGVALSASIARYALHGIEVRFFDGTWPSKASYAFFVEFAAESLRFLFYVVFFGMVFASYGVPLHIVRELWVSYVSLRRRFAHYRRYRALTADMDERFADATPEDLERDRVCIICRETMDAGKKLPCGHVFHLSCLRLWLQQQQSCPTCRADIPIDHHVGRQRAGADAAARRREEETTEEPPPQEQPQPQAQPPPQPSPPPAAAAENNTTDTFRSSLATNVLMSIVGAARNLDGRPRLPRGASIYRVSRPLGVKVLIEKRPDAQTHRTISYGSHVLALADDQDPAYLRVGDGWLFNDDSITPFTMDDPPAQEESAFSSSSSSPVLLALEGIQAQLADLKAELGCVRQENADLRAAFSAQAFGAAPPEGGGAPVEEQKSIEAPASTIEEQEAPTTTTA
ncbi:hypothetical protein CTAYLR_003087 [Chrysophaeum taylorii]|uniref:RING-type E3 ubiquitin transferase n=1 Tax=Chrysophaeum taylorii TaxID=2483200 RepID=A0AAD7U7E9_9STRA|nr:hypothetical protein CTAYLR_003087 [Chrysophaeum taylorii]